MKTRSHARMVVALLAALLFSAAPARAQVIPAVVGGAARARPGKGDRGDAKTDSKERKEEVAKPAAKPSPNPAAAAPPKPTSPASPAAVPPPPGAPPGGIVLGGDLPGEKEFNSCKKFPAGKRIVKLNLKPETELGDLIGWISTITCKQFLIPSTVPIQGKKITIISPQLITPEEAYRLFVAALESLGLTVEPSGKFLRILETGKAKGSSIPFYGTGEDIPSGDSFVTRLIRVENVDLAEIVNVIQTLRSDSGVVTPFPPQGTIIITDAATNVGRIAHIVDELDVPGDSEKIWMLRMKNSAATEMAQKLAEIFTVQQLGGRRSPGAPAPAAAGKPGAPGSKRSPSDLAADMVITKMIPDERSNQLIVIASDKAYARLLSLVKRLDVPIEGGDGRIHVYYCENANCDELARTLGSITGVSVAGGGGVRRAGRASAGGPAPAPAPGPAGGPGQQGQTGYLFEGEVRMSFDGPTNALIVLSSLKDYQSLRKVIERLDSPRKQIYIEATVMEVLLDKTRDLGAAYHGGLPEQVFGKDALVLGGFDAKKTLNPAGLLTDATALMGLGAGVFGPPLAGATNLFGSAAASATVPSFGVFLMALQRSNNVNVLSSPHITIQNNEDGEIAVGQNIPFPGALLGGFGGLPGQGGLGGLFPQVSVQRQDVALKLKLTPTVNEHNMVRLVVDQEISDIASPNFNGLGPSTSKRTAKTTVVARDQQTIVIGGLMADRTIDRVTKVPILGDIPILGFFFRNTTKTIQKSNIVIALTPYVITDQSDIRRVMEKKMRERREFIERFGAQEDEVDLEAEKDYAKKRGFLEEINRAAREIDEEEALMRQIRERDLAEEVGPIELPASYKPPGAAGSGTTPPPPVPPARPGNPPMPM